MKVSILLNLQTTQVGGLHMPGKMENVALHNHYGDLSAFPPHDKRMLKTGNREKNSVFFFLLL